MQKKFLAMFALVALILTACGRTSLLQGDFSATTSYESLAYQFAIELPRQWRVAMELGSESDLVISNLSDNEIEDFKAKKSGDESDFGFLPGFYPEQHRMASFYLIENNPVMFACVFDAKISEACGELPEFQIFDTQGIPGLLEISDQNFGHYLYFPLAEDKILAVEYFPEEDGDYSEKYFEKMLGSLQVDSTFYKTK